MKALETAIAAWAKDWKAENIDEPTRRLIPLANFDLYHGPVGDGAYGDPADDDPEEWAGYPGFSKAADAIARALDALPSALFLDVDTGYCQESEPDPERCEDCDGSGETTMWGDNVIVVRCDACHGRGCFEASGEWYRLDRGELKRAIVGNELAQYV